MAIPEVDVGEDLFVIDDNADWRVPAELTAEQRAIVTPPWELSRVVRPREAPARHVAA